MKRKSRINPLPLAWAEAPAEPPAGTLTELGAQSFSFRQFDLQGALDALARVGLNRMEFCAVHFPPDAKNPEFPAVREAILGAEVKTPCFGVEHFTADEAASRSRFDFAGELGAAILTADPDRESFAHLEKLCQETGIRIAIHNHGPEARYNHVADTLRAAESYGEAIGACVDTGHSLRTPEKPEDVIRQLGRRVHSLHLKDWKIGGDEQVLGEGDMNLHAVVEALLEIAFDGPMMLEYELDPEDPVDGMRRGVENWRAAVREVLGAR